MKTTTTLKTTARYFSLIGLSLIFSCKPEALNEIDEDCFGEQFSATFINGNLVEPLGEMIDGVNISEMYGANVLGEWSFSTDFDNYELSINSAPIITQAAYESLSLEEWKQMIAAWNEDNKNELIQQLIFNDNQSSRLYLLEDVVEVSRTFNYVQNSRCDFLTISFAFETKDEQFEVSSTFRVAIPRKL
ncbi:MAG: hypothetical protein LAT68_10595 [Cyclobacteriaceae bacterium]|nr:hypothetical protein [Cyclobacteriaceae bacterium]